MDESCKTKNRYKIIITVLVVLLIAVCIFAVFLVGKHGGEDDIFKHNELEAPLVVDNSDGYELEQVLIISRHNIRSPLSGRGSLLGEITPHEWFAWTSNPSELSIKGGQLETAMGQFYRKYLEAKGLIPENWMPEKGEVRFYANSMQRTISTAEFFASGMLPVGNPEIEYHEEYGGVDSIFCPIVRFTSPEFEAQVMAEINENMPDLKEAYALLEEVLDFKDSDYAKENNISAIPTDDTGFTLTVGEEIQVSGGLKIANAAVDALKLQIYEEDDIEKALFGHKMTEEQIKKICTITDAYQEACEGAPTLAKQVMGSIIAEMEKELDTPNRKVSFLCGHDSTLTALVAALDIKEYELPGAISCKAPIGGKMVWEKYRGADGNEYIKLIMCYNTTEQLRKCGMLSMDNPPMLYELELECLQKNADGYYKYEDVIASFEEALSHEYDYVEVPMDAAA